MTHLMHALGASKTPKHGTPRWLFDDLNREFGFTVDVCATPELAKCPRYFTPEIDGLAQSWKNEIAWMNPPYGMHHLWSWMHRATWAAYAENTTVVGLVPCRTEQLWWHEWVWDQKAQRSVQGLELRFLQGRLVFQGSKHNAPFSSAVLVLRPGTFGDRQVVRYAKTSIEFCL